MRRTVWIVVACAFSLALAIDAKAQRSVESQRPVESQRGAEPQRGRGAFRAPINESRTDDYARTADHERGMQNEIPGAAQPARRGRGRGGRFGGGQPQGGGPSAGGGRFGGGAATNKLFAALDADGDGVITQAEMEDAILAFARLDEDKDGKLTREEAGATGGGGHGHGHGSGSGMAGGRGRIGANPKQQGTAPPQGRGRGGFGRARGSGQRPALEEPEIPKDSNNPAPSEKKPTTNSTSSNMRPLRQSSIES